MTVITFHVNFTDPLKSQGEDFFQARIKNGVSIDIIESFSVTKKRKLNSVFKEAVALCKTEDRKLLVNSFDSFKRNFDCINILWEGKIDFEFLDFPFLNKANIKLLKEYLEYSKSIRGDKIRSTIKTRKEEGKKQGLEHLSKRKLRKVSATANHYKKLAIAIDPIQDALRKKIYELREEKGYSLQKIADILNEMGEVSPTGKEFHPKTISRFLHAAEDSKERFKNNEELEDEASALRGAGGSVSKKEKKKTKKKLNSSTSSDDQKDLPTPSSSRPQFKLQGILNNSDFKESIKFKILKTDKLTKGIIVELYDNKEDYKDDKKPIYRDVYPPNSKVIKIDLEGIEGMYPGRYYLKVLSVNHEVKGVTRSFFYHKEKDIQ